MSSHRITEKMLICLIDLLNIATHSPSDPYRYVEVDGVKKKLVANVGNFHLGGAYGGVSLERMSNEGGGVYLPLGFGHVPKRELWNQIQAMLDGIRMMEQTKTYKVRANTRAKGSSAEFAYSWSRIPMATMCPVLAKELLERQGLEVKKVLSVSGASDKAARSSESKSFTPKGSN